MDQRPFSGPEVSRHSMIQIHAKALLLSKTRMAAFKLPLGNVLRLCYPSSYTKTLRRREMGLHRPKLCQGAAMLAGWMCAGQRIV